jgi:CRP-like cAMP-binding protein
MRFLEFFNDWEDTVDLTAGTVIFSEQAPADIMYVVLSGDVDLTLHGKPLGVEGAGGVIGEMAMLDVATRSSTATARTAVRLARLDREQLRKIARDNAEFSFHVMSVLANRLRSVDTFISSQISAN